MYVLYNCIHIYIYILRIMIYITLFDTHGLAQLVRSQSLTHIRASYKQKQTYCIMTSMTYMHVYISLSLSLSIYIYIYICTRIYEIKVLLIYDIFKKETIKETNYCIMTSTTVRR